MSFGLIVLTRVQKKARFAKQPNDPPMTIIGIYVKQLCRRSSRTSHKHITCILKHVYQSPMHFKINYKLINILHELSTPKSNPKSKTEIKINSKPKSKRNPIPYHIQNANPSQINSIAYPKSKSNAITNFITYHIFFD